ncbi:multiple sugar transport system permease protein [Actinoalloteichus hoggarensis]|uniref:L-arabinose transport system permease protein AraP n=1 Tax=Actinoalloteichus hoggarensis TaxID=1470176 RepID=A0A221W4U8_9PSEU|nr:sugar ABC transporter permease [Actinoalloteichus hoggarensis]ASO20794.1 L-arabinose transport system permease protein AraP [Actinoalloteichus hoggarensis]MBB5920724.1 multiple sugar transport system permease protein [Actinoalloteichus hoggarensis]
MRSTGTTAAPRRRRGTDRTTQALVLSLPASLVVGLLFVVPLGLLVWMSMTDWPLLGEPSFVGFAQYGAILDDPLFLDAVWFTARYTVITTVLLTAVALGLALLVQQTRLGTGLLRTAFFLPASMGLAVAALLWFALYSDEVGPLSDVLMALGLVAEPVNWLGTPDGALWSTVLMVLWRFAGFYMIILLTGLQSIPTQVYEAARIDGAGWWRTFTGVTLPLLRPTLALVLVLSVTGSLLAFEQFYVLTGGGPDNSTVTVVSTIFRQAFTLFDLSRAAAMSVVVLIALVLANIVQLSLIRKGADS